MEVVIICGCFRLRFRRLTIRNGGGVGVEGESVVVKRPRDGVECGGAVVKIPRDGVEVGGWRWW